MATKKKVAVKEVKKEKVLPMVSEGPDIIAGNKSDDVNVPENIKEDNDG